MNIARRFRIPVYFLLLSFAMPAGAEVIVSGSRLPKYDRTSPVSTISAEDLELSGITSASDLLNSSSGLAIRNRGESHTNPTVNVRGLQLGPSRTLVLINGRRRHSTDTTINTDDLNTIPPNAIERIEIVKDGAAAIYGSDAINGVINIITKDDYTTAKTGDDFGTTNSGSGTIGNNFGLELQDWGGIVSGGNPSGDAAAGGNFIPAEITPGLGIYDNFVRGFTGSIDFNALCDYGSAGVLPGTFLSPWTYGHDYQRKGDNFFVPFEQSDPAVDNNAPAANNDSGGNDTPAANSNDGQTTDATPDSSTDTSAGSANSAGGDDQSGAAQTQQTATLTGLQQWDRGVPPWSLVQRSPEVAHLLDQLRPYYELRMATRAQMSALGYWGLSESELAENADDYNAARDLWKGTRREIITILGPHIAPEIAATLNTGDPVWDGDAGPVLPADVFTEMFPNLGSVEHPSQKPGQQAATESTANEGSGAYAQQLTEGEYSDFRIGIKGLYGNDYNIGRYKWRDEFADTEAAPTVGGLSVQPFLGEYQYQPNGTTTIKPLEGGLFDPSYPYDTKFPQPRRGGLPDWQFNSDLPSDRGFSGTHGGIQYGDTSFDVDKYITPRFTANFEYLDEAESKASTATQGTGFDSYDLQSSGRFQDYDTRTTTRQNFISEYGNPITNGFDFKKAAAWGTGFRTPTIAELFRASDISENRIAYNLQAGVGAITLPLTSYDGATVRSKQPLLSGTPGGLGESAAGDAWRPFVSSQWKINDNFYTTFRWSEGAEPKFDLSQTFGSGTKLENDYCATEAFPGAASTSSIVDGKRINDEWFFDRIGVGEPAAGAPVTVAIIDTGLDYHHQDISWDQLWYNEGEIRDNGLDDDGNGFVDDIFGWDFTVNSNTPWDHDGHGTFVTGLIASKRDNLTGIQGLNPNARIMVLKALNNFGHTRASWMSQAIVYATDNGARIINLSAAGPGLPEFVQDAVNYADSKGVLVFVAAGNTAENVDGIGPAGLENVITVAATGLDDSRAPFSNWGKRIDIAAPGMHIKSLRSRQTDFRLTSLDGNYKRGSAILDGDRRSYRADGTSFAAPLAAGVAALIWSQNPNLSHTQVRRMLVQSARDIDTPGRDQFTGYGLLDASAALKMDPAFYTQAEIIGVAIASIDGKQVARVTGTTDANEFAGAEIQIGAGDNPSSWKKMGNRLTKPVINNVLADIAPKELQGAPVWTIRVVTQHKDKSTREARYRLNIGG